MGNQDIVNVAVVADGGRSGGTTELYDCVWLIGSECKGCFCPRERVGGVFCQLSVGSTIVRNGNLQEPSAIPVQTVVVG